MFIFWVFSFVAEGLLYIVPHVWSHWRRQATILLMLLVTVTTIGFAHNLSAYEAIPVLLLAIVRLLNLGRIVKGRMHEAYLFRAASRTSWWVFGGYTILAWSLMLSLNFTTSWWQFLNVLLFMQLVVAAGILTVTLKNIKKLSFKSPATYLSDSELPTVTVAIPARNETVDLDACLRSVLANDYPKLEVIVLDDCSHGRTADIIRSFAHDGVRFVPGDEPAERWLAKNQAYEKLAHEASGDLLLFCGVDVRFGPSAIRQMVNVLHDRDKTMLSVLPVRDQSTAAAAFIQPIRYWWELALPRRLFNRPPVLSTCWLIKRKSLKKLGGFASVSHAILPEGYFARELVKIDGYSFLRSSGDLDVRTVKSLSDQRETTLRVRYPQIKRRPELAALLALFEAVFFLLPFVLLVGSVWFWPFINPLVPLATCLLLIATHETVIRVTNPANRFTALWNFPLAVVTEICLGLASMIIYEFFTVTWKGRNICIPVMHVIPHLPSLPAEESKR